MSWDIYIQDLPRVASVKDIPEAFRPQPIGDRATFINLIKEVVPFAEEQDDNFYVNAPDIDLSLSLGREPGTELLNYIVIHVHAGDHSPACAAAIVKATGLQALDTATSEFFNADAPEHGFKQWSVYRDEVLRQH
jgi:hypothetical protein